MGVDMFGRLDGLITSVSKAAREKKEWKEVTQHQHLHEA